MTHHPAQTLRFLVPAILLTAAGLFCTALALDDPQSTESAFYSVLANVLLVLGVINFAVHSVAVLLRRHEMWRNSHFTEVIETEE
ncbi:hypothetical protein CS0771_19310 [Catellatospora sp. IY07-71]|uniref:hypothetical protein n=1 Tax=Catellatospora sp. IY07-71 TaxID=2728827 RepID=UPI001BB40BAD|nr:hypothetical protein [Catellatospora sp. IY07-71]BCJ72387.1 hypothetical protein CS0771_19310 [Catellatospora sp. IY07-71]